MTRRREVVDMGGRPQRRGRGPHRLTVLAPTAVDVVAFAGGWLFDRVAAGWNVSVFLVEHSAEQSLRILGADNVDLCTAGMCAQQVRVGGAVALSTELVSDGHPFRPSLLRAFGARRTAVTLWGNSFPAELSCGADPLTYQLSTAAQAFKAHALVAAGAPREMARPTELFRRGIAHPTAVESVLPLA
jgi:hypothetical protein